MKLQSIRTLIEIDRFCWRDLGFKLLPDKICCGLLFFRKLGYPLNLDNPKTFNEKIQWLKLYDRNPEYTKIVDKYEAKKYFLEKIGGEYLIPQLGIWDCFNDIDFSKLPDQFVLKCTHDNGSVVICRDKALFNFDSAKKKLSKALTRNKYYQFREWPYKNVKPRIIAEKFLSDGSGDNVDYKLMCFNGKVRFYHACSKRFSAEGVHVTYFDNSGNRLAFKEKGRPCDDKVKKPVNFEKMLKLAERFARGTAFLRVDFFEIDNRVYLGELTFYPDAGFSKFDLEGCDEQLGSWITLPSKVIPQVFTESPEEKIAVTQNV
jgi:hypothetical protein